MTTMETDENPMSRRGRAAVASGLDEVVRTLMAAPRDPFEHVRRLISEPAFTRQLQEMDQRVRDIADPPVLRQLREMRERMEQVTNPPVLRHLHQAVDVGRYTSGLNVASNLEGVGRLLPESMRGPMLALGTDVTRMLAGSTAVAAWAETQVVQARIAELIRPRVSLEVTALPALEQWTRLGDRLNRSARMLAHLELPAVLGRATADSTHGLRLLLDGLEPTRFVLPSVESAGTFTFGTSTSARLLRPLILDDNDEDDLDVHDRPLELVAEVTLGDGMRRALHLRLSALHPKIVERVEGAWSRLDRNEPDAASQAAHSTQELLDSALQLAAPDAEVLAWHRVEGRPESELHNGKPTRALRTRYLLGPRAADKAGAFFLKSIDGFVGVLQDAKHNIDSMSGRVAVRSVLANVEAFLYFVFAPEED